MAIKGFIKILLINKGVTMTDLADRVGESLPNLSNKLRRNSLRYDEAEKIAEALGMRIEWVDK